MARRELLGKGVGVRLPLQGGLPPAGEVTGAVVEIACDESGFSGTNLLDPATPVITHASVDLSGAEAVGLIADLRSRFRFSPDEFKSGPFLRGPQADEALDRLLIALTGRAHVHVVDKQFFLATRIVDLFLAEPSYAAGTRLAQEHRPAALALYAARDAPGWRPFLEAFVALARIKHKHRPDPAALTGFFRAGDDLALTWLDRARVEAVLTRLYAEDPAIPPPLEPLLPALAETVLFWSDGGRRRVLVTHDEQSALTAGRLTRLQEALAGSAGISPLAGLVVVDSRDDPRVQVADLLAGIARRRPASVRRLGASVGDAPQSTNESVHN